VKKFKLGIWLDERLGITGLSQFGKKKEVPQHKHTIWYYTGSSILLFFTIQVITGFMLILYYKPTLEQANESVAAIITEVPLGWIIRSIHSWSASFMIVFVMIHMISIWLTKSYRTPRELTWMTGVLLMGLSLAFGFTGYLLPWDELSLSATKVGTDIPRTIPLIGEWITKFLRGGEDVTGDTLTRFFGIHVSILPIAIFLVLALHVFLIQKHGISLPLSYDIEGRKAKAIPFWPNFMLRESIVWLFLIGVLFTVAIVFPHHLGQPADLTAPAPEGIKPEWYFLFLFQTLKIFPAHMLFIEGETLAVILILLGAVLFFFLPVLDTDPAGKKGKIITIIAIFFLIYAVGMSIWSLL